MRNINKKNLEKFFKFLNENDKENYILKMKKSLKDKKIIKK